MFGNREFVVRTRKVDRNSNHQETLEQTVDIDQDLANARDEIKTFVCYAAIGAGAYIIFDAYRQIQIAKHTQPIYR